MFLFVHLFCFAATEDQNARQPHATASWREPHLSVAFHEGRLPVHHHRVVLRVQKLVVPVVSHRLFEVGQVGFTMFPAEGYRDRRT